MLKPIPGPQAYPVIGNLLDVMNDVPVFALGNIADKYGEIYQLTTRGKKMIVVSSSRLANEVCDETRFYKVLAGGLARVRRSGPTGLFTSPSEKDPDWEIAHRVLVPAFGPLAIQGMFDEMLDIASQLLLKWARMGPDHTIVATEDFTRLTLDTIALCAMGHRFNSFYQDEMPPFVQAMTRTLGAGNPPSSLYQIVQSFASKPASMQRDQDFMAEVANQLVQERKQNPVDKNDILNAMINGKDSKTGQKMSDGLITANMITFLIAGHETTSGLLSFAFANMLKHPATLQKAQQEVDRVIGNGRLKVEHLKELKYVNAVLRETIRLNPTAPAFVRAARENNPEVYALGEYEMHKDWPVYVLLTKTQRDPAVYGEDAEDFKPERMLEDFDQLPKAAWTPFGTGVRACIGRAFAWQEALLVTALVLQNFDMVLENPSYQLHVKQTLTIKPADLNIKARLRNRDALAISKGLTGMTNGMTNGDAVPTEASAPAGPKILILYGSNTGTCQTLARRLAADARSRGFETQVDDLDAGVSLCQGGQSLVVVTSSYEGQPPDNAGQFVELLSGNSGSRFKGTKYAVFGCGHSDWKNTYQRIPSLVDEMLEKVGAERIVSRGETNVAQADIFGDFDAWSQKFWPSFGGKTAQKSLTQASKLELEIRPSDRFSSLRQDVTEAVVDSTRILTVDEPEKRHMDILLPTSLVYEPGDYLAVLPLNPERCIQRVMRKFHLPWDAQIQVNDAGATILPVGKPMSVQDLLRGYVELSQPMTKMDLRTLVEHATEASRDEIQALLNESFHEVAESHLSLLDFIESRLIDLPFNDFLALLPPMRLRYYSISSSPLIDPHKCSITYSVVRDKSTHGGFFEGVASTYLKSLQPGDSLHVAVRSTNKLFRLPAQPQVPLIMICAGTGLAPFRAFVEHRAAQLEASPDAQLAPAMLFVGCRSASGDRLYTADFDKWRNVGAVDIRYAFSNDAAHELANGCSHVQDRLLHDRDILLDLWRKDAKLYICGSSRMAKGVGQVARQLIRQVKEPMLGRPVSDVEVEAWMQEKNGQRYFSDLFD